MKYSKNIYFALTLMIILLGCKEDYEVKPATYSLMLTGEENKTWQQTSFTFIFIDEEVGDIDANQIYGIPECAQDDQYNFIRDGKILEVFDGRSKCDPDDEDLLFRSSWDIVNANATIFIGGTDYILSVLTEDSLVFGFMDTLVAPVGESTFWEYPGEARWVYKPIN